jgi:hypothetical protein
VFSSCNKNIAYGIGPANGLEGFFCNVIVTPIAAAGWAGALVGQKPRIDAAIFGIL